MSRTEDQQSARDRQAKDQFEAWLGSLPRADRLKLKRRGIVDADISRRVSKGQYEEELIERAGCRQSYDFDESEGVGSIEMRIQERAKSIVRMALADLLSPRPGVCVAQLVDIIGLSLGMPGMPGMTGVAKRHGVGKAAISKACRKFCAENDLKPSCYMLSECQCEVHRANNVRRRAAV